MMLNKIVANFVMFKVILCDVTVYFLRSPLSQARKMQIGWNVRWWLKENWG